MKKISIILLLIYFFLVVVSSCSPNLKKPDNTKIIYEENLPKTYADPDPLSNQDSEIARLKASYIEKYQNYIPKEWGENVAGVIRKIGTSEKVIALTFDACGGSALSNSYDKDIIDFLKKEGISATLFINTRWIDANYDIFVDLSKNQLFEIENHGYLHRPLSVNGKSAYGIQGTANVGDVIEEIMRNQLKIEQITGRKPKYFRSGTAYYDEIAVRIANELGLKVMNYNVLGDAGATFSKDQVKSACLSSTPGSIVLLHMNHPEKETAEGVIASIPALRNMGFKFVKLQDFDQYLNPERTIQNYINYGVIAGDTLWKISTKYSVSIQDIINTNSLKSTVIYIGQILKIPTKDVNNTIIYTVLPGDTLWKIALKFNTTIEDIARKNGLDVNKYIVIGQKLRI